MTLQRYLDKCECALGKAPTLVFEYEGVIRETELRNAVDILGVRYPIIRAQVVRDETGYLLHVPPNSNTELIILDGDHEAMEREAGAPWDVSSAIVRIILVRERSHGFLGVRVDNSVFDGASRGPILADLWQVYTDLVAGKSIEPDPGELPRGPYEFYRREGWMDDDPSESTLLTSLPSVLLGTTCIQMSGSLNGGDTAAVFRAAAAHQTTVHPLLCGAALSSLRD